jgi:hypothetical protein
VASLLAEPLDLLGQLRKLVEAALAGKRWDSFSHADTEALAFVHLANTDVAAIVTLGHETVDFVIPATGAARSAFESVVTAAWMVAPDEAAERDRRWLALFIEERSYWKRMVEEAKERNDTAPIIAGLEHEHARVDKILAEVKPQFDAIGSPQPEKVPTMDLRLEAVGLRRQYVAYKTACQLVHPAIRALSLVRDLTDHAQGVDVASFSHRTRERDWIPAILLGAESMYFGLETLGKRLQPSRDLYSEAVAPFNAVVDTVRRLVEAQPATPPHG